MKRRDFLATAATAGAVAVGTTFVQACSTPVKEKTPLRETFSDEFELQEVTILQLQRDM